jgi:hypothetical protein
MRSLRANNEGRVGGSSWASAFQGLKCATQYPESRHRLAGAADVAKPTSIVLKDRSVFGESQ